MYLLNFSSTVLPLAMAGGGQGDGGGLVSVVIMMALIVGIFYFLVIRPQKKQQEERQAMIESLREGQRVVTSGGIHGQVTSISDNTVKVRVAKEIKLTFNKSSIMTVKGEEDEE
ncbi:MAG: preprotein translocase subunit YajC [bacterium]